MKKMIINTVSFNAIIKISLAIFLIVLTACTSTSGPVVIRESSAPIATKKDDNAVDTENKQAMVQPVAPDRSANRIPALEKLLAHSNIEIVNRNYDKAISLAERGLRISRKDPRLYLALSKAHKGEGNRQQSVYFAKQGLRYSERESDVSQALKQLAR